MSNDFEIEDDEWSDNEDFGVASTGSVAKGVFVFKNKPAMNLSSPSKSRQRMLALQPKLDSEIQNLFGIESENSERFRKMRLQSFREILDRISKIISEQQKEVFGKMLLKVTDFVRECSSFNNTSISLIPTCVLLTGINSPDHGDLFSHLRKHLTRNVSSHVATVKSSACSNLKGLVARTVTQLKSKDDSVNDPESSDSESENDVAGKIKRGQSGSLRDLRTWYINQYPIASYPQKSAKKNSESSSDRPPLIIIVEDFEGFHAQMLEDFILNLSMCSQDLPLILIFGVATVVDVVHQSLPISITSRLAMQLLTTEPSTEIFHRFFKSLIASPEIPFKLGAKVFRSAYENFTFSDLSMKNVLSAYKWSLIEHFSSNPASILCLSESSKRQNLIEKQFSDNDLDRFRKIRSFVELVDSNPSKYADLMTDPQKFRDFLLVKVEILFQKSETFNIFVGALQVIAKGLPVGTLGQRFYSIYCTCICEPVTKSDEYRKLDLHLKISERSDLEIRLDAFVNYLKEFSELNQEASNAAAMGQKLLDELRNFDSRQNKECSPSKVMSVTPQKVDNETSEIPKSESLVKDGNISPRKRQLLTPADSKSKKVSRFQIQANLLQAAKEESNKEKKIENPFVLLRKKIIDFFFQVFSKNLGDGPTTCIPSKQVFHEIQYFDEFEVMKDQFYGDQIVSLKTALLDPEFYIQDPGLKVESVTDILPEMPDIVIGYKLYLECQRYINLFDWLQCWSTIVNINNDEINAAEKIKKSKSKIVKKKNKPKKGEQVPDEEPHEEEEGVDKDLVQRYQARFTQAVSDLQFIGYIRSSKRKTDHVEKLGLSA